mmetsp:Transcript_5059/g.16469  ORF Transcript_5059/g.16469 Transcript_5059/m.16469 type:complete len:308 (+) Transcript_5059:243-1166(+)
MPTSRNVSILAAVCATFVQALGPMITRYSRGAKQSYDYNPKAAILLAELLKLLVCCAILFLKIYQGMARPKLLPSTFLHFGVPAGIYFAQNLVVYTSLQYVSGSTHVTILNIRILFTSLLTYFFIKEKYTSVQWTACILAASGAIIYSLSNDDPSQTFSDPYYVYGALLTVIAAFTASSATVYTQWRMQMQPSDSLFWQNIQLYLWGSSFAMCSLLFEQYFRPGKDMFGKFDHKVLIVIVYYVVYGLCISSVLKLLGSMQRAYISCAALPLTGFLDLLLFREKIGEIQAISCVIIVCGIYLYNYEKR